MKALGNNVIGRRWISIAIALFVLLLPDFGHAAEAGKFQFVIGDIKVISASGAERIPVKGEAFNSGETIDTGASGSAQIRMSDGGLVAVRPDTQMKLDQYVFNGREDGSERKLVSLMKGGFRAITGLIGNRNKENYKILTPSATIGIRGTDHEAVVITEGAAGGFQAGTYDRVYRGATIIETDKGKLIVNPNQVGFTPGKGAAPVLLPKIPEFFNTKSQKPEGVKETQKEAYNAVPGDSSKLDSQNNDSSGSLAADLAVKVDGDSKDAITLRNPLDSPTVQAQASTIDRKESSAMPLTDVPMQSDQSIPSIKSMQKAEDLSHLKVSTSKGKSKEVTPAQITIAFPAPIMTATTPAPVSTDTTNVPVATFAKNKASKNP